MESELIDSDTFLNDQQPQQSNSIESGDKQQKKKPRTAKDIDEEPDSIQPLTEAQILAQLDDELARLPKRSVLDAETIEKLEDYIAELKQRNEATMAKNRNKKLSECRLKYRIHIGNCVTYSDPVYPNQIDDEVQRLIKSNFESHQQQQQQKS